MLIVQIYLYIYICVQKHVQFICVMHTCEMFFHVLVCMQWTSCVHAMDMLWIDHHCIFCAPAIYMCSILVPIHLCVSLICAVAMYLSGVYLCQFTSAEIVAFIFRFVGKDAYVPVV